MEQKKLLKRLEEIEANAQRLIEDVTALREELSGGSDSSILKTSLSKKMKSQIVNRRRKTQLRNDSN